jgi:hypothetical protein
MRRLSLLILLAVASVTVQAAVNTGLKAAIEKGMVKVAATTTGMVYHGKALKLQVSNTTRERLQITVDPALIFRPEDKAYQDLVLPAEEMLAIAPGSMVEIDVQTFCGKLHASAPGAKLSYKFWKQGDSNLIKVTQYIRKNQLFDYLGQQAVWVITDGNDLEGIIDPAKPKQSADLLALLVKLTGRQAPEYFRYYKLDTVAGQPVFKKRVLKIITNIDWKLEEASPVTLGIYNATGDLVQGVLDEKQMAKGGYRMQVQFEAENAPPGAYYMRLKRDDKLMKEIKVTVE